MQMILGAQPSAMQHQHASWIEDYEKDIINGPPVDESLYDEPPPQPDAAYTLVHDLGGRKKVKVRESRSLETREEAQTNQEAPRLLAQPPPIHATSSIAPPTAPPVPSTASIAPPPPPPLLLPTGPIALPPPPPIVLPPIAAFAPPVAASIATAPPLVVCAPPTPITRTFMREFGILRVGQGTRFEDYDEEPQIDNHRPSGMVALLKDRVLVALRL
ncbi:hypothetical protein GGG16DRAFT_125539 [Schizophyllum commune]